MITYSNEDECYLSWIASNPEGYVVNIERSLNPNDVMLHKADCYTIKGVPARGDSWTNEYIKICSTSREELCSWITIEIGGEVRKCKLCNP